MITTLGYPYNPRKGFLKSFGIKEVFTTTSPVRWLWELYRYWYIRRRYKTINLADAKVFHSGAVLEWALRQGIKEPILIHNAIELKLPNKIFSRKKIRKEFRIPEKARVITFLSAFNVGKGVDMLFKLIERSKELPANTYFLIFGNGAEREKIIKLAQTNERVLYNGKLPHDEIYKAYKASDVVLMPSKYEPFSRIVVESISMGTPVVSSNKGGGKEVIIDGKTGFLVDSEKVEEWIEAINKALKKNMHSSHKAEFEKVAKSYSKENAFNGLSKVYHDIIAGIKPSSTR